MHSFHYGEFTNQITLMWVISSAHLNLSSTLYIKTMNISTLSGYTIETHLLVSPDYQGTVSSTIEFLCTHIHNE